MKKIITIALLSIGSLNAATTTGNLSATATLNASCTVASEPVSFGVINPSSNTTAIGLVTVICTNGTSYSYVLSKGNGSSFMNRWMVGSSGNNDTLKYNIYGDTAQTNVLGDGSGGGVRSGVGTGLAQRAQIYGVVPSGQYVRADNYSDELIVTVRY